MRYLAALPLLLPITLAACQSAGDEDRNTEVWDGIGPEETVYFGGTEPFWGGEASGKSATYTTPENIEGTTFPITRFAGNSGIAISGTLGDAKFDMTVTEGECSDGMSDRSYPFTVTLKIGDATRYGCAHTDARPFTGPEKP